MQAIDEALDKGYTLSLDCDVSEATFSGKNGVAVIPENEADAKTILTEIKPEKKITQEYRQQEFENLTTQDDHLMHIVGKVIDQKGNLYYKIKNSWGDTSGKDGFMYMSVSYLRLKALSVLVHQDALSPATKKALQL
jgi:bleomycin hydrolase